MFGVQAPVALPRQARSARLARINSHSGLPADLVHLSAGRIVGRRDHVNQTDDSLLRTAGRDADYPPSASYMCHEHGTTGNGRQSVRVLLNAPESSSGSETEHEKRAVGEHSNRQIAPHDTACVPGHSEGFPKPGGPVAARSFRRPASVSGRSTSTIIWSSSICRAAHM